MTIPRVHARAAVGDRFGAVEIVKLLPSGHRGRSDERVRWRCACGVVGDSYVFNLRTRKPHCLHRLEERP